MKKNTYVFKTGGGVIRTVEATSIEFTTNHVVFWDASEGLGNIALAQQSGSCLEIAQLPRNTHINDFLKQYREGRWN